MLLADKIVSFIAPHQCIVCRSEGAVLCALCLETAGEPPAPRCVGCKQLSENYRTCSSCRSWIDIYAVYVATVYDGVYETLLREYKFKLKRQAVEPLVAIMTQLPLQFDDAELVIVPLPSAPKRIRLRGFDHGLLLARYLTKYLNKMYKVTLTCSPVLGRHSNARQLGSSRAQRIRQVQGDFFLKSGHSVVGKTILLCDDVTTTGASLAAAAQVLKQAGAKRIYAIVYAQKM